MKVRRRAMLRCPAFPLAVIEHTWITETIGGSQDRFLPLLSGLRSFQPCHYPRPAHLVG